METMKSGYSTIQKATPKDKGNALELNVQHIFRVAGFDSKQNVRIMKYEIDVLVEIGDRKIVIECKNYQNSNLTVRNLIHQWRSKNDIIRANKIILAIAGVNIKNEDYLLASDLNIEIWNEKDIEELFNLTLHPDELRTRLLNKIDFRPVQISDVYGRKIAIMKISSELCGLEIQKEYLYKQLNEWLRIFIRTELQLTGTTNEERLKHIQLFEGAKEQISNHFFNLIKSRKARTEVEYWDKVRNDLSTVNILDSHTQEKYLKHMDNLISEVKLWDEFFLNEDEPNRFKTKLHYRLDYSTMTDQECEFGSHSGNDSVRINVLPGNDGQYNIVLKNITRKSANMICWILTSEYEIYFHDEGKTICYSWACSNISDATEEVYRLCTEFYDIRSDNLRDYNLTTYKFD